MRTLVYKRTHIDDPAEGCFGSHDCMGTVRDREYDAVIGIGGTGDEPRSYRIDGKITWVGIGPHRRRVPGKRGAEVTFDHFQYFGEKGPELEQYSPLLADRFYRGKARWMVNLSPEELAEAACILALAKDAPPSPALAGSSTKANGHCGPAPAKRLAGRGC